MGEVRGGAELLVEATSESLFILFCLVVGVYIRVLKQMWRKLFLWAKNSTISKFFPHSHNVLKGTAHFHASIGAIV